MFIDSVYGKPTGNGTLKAPFDSLKSAGAETPISAHVEEDSIVLKAVGGRNQVRDVEFSKPAQIRDDVIFHNCVFTQGLQVSGAAQVTFHNCTFQGAVRGQDASRMRGLGCTFQGQQSLVQLQGRSLMDCVGCHFEAIDAEKVLVAQDKDSTLRCGACMFIVETSGGSALLKRPVALTWGAGTVDVRNSTVLNTNTPIQGGAKMGKMSGCEVAGPIVA